MNIKNSILFSFIYPFFTFFIQKIKKERRVSPTYASLRDGGFASYGLLKFYFLELFSIFVYSPALPLFSPLA